MLFPLAFDEVHAVDDRPSRLDRRLSQRAAALAARRGYWRAIVAIAAKNARMAWALLSRGEQFTIPS